MGAVSWNLVVSLGRSRPVNEADHSAFCLKCQNNLSLKINRLVHVLVAKFYRRVTAYSPCTLDLPPPKNLRINCATRFQNLAVR